MDGTVECHGPRGVCAAGARRWLSNHIWRILLGRERLHAESEAQQGRVHSYTPSLPLRCLTEAPETPNMKLARQTAMEALQNSSTASQAPALPFAPAPGVARLGTLGAPALTLPCATSSWWHRAASPGDSQRGQPASSACCGLEAAPS